MLHRLCGPPSIHLSFNLAAVLPRRRTYCVSCATKDSRTPTASSHRLRRGLPGYLILFAPTAFEPPGRSKPGKPPRPLLFSRIFRLSPSPLGFPSPFLLFYPVVLVSISPFKPR